MREHTITIATPAGPLPLFVALPDDARFVPGVLVYMDVFGLREELYEITRRYATCGYMAVLPDLFHRLGSPRFPPANRREDAVPAAAHAANDATTMQMSSEDAGAIFSHADRGAFGVRVGRWGIIGYCMGGRHAIATAVNHPQHIGAALSIHGGRLVAAPESSETSPHLLLRKCRAQLHLACAKDDATCPPEHQAILEAEASESESRVTLERIDALHGWTFPDRWCFDRRASDRVWEKSLEMFRSALWTRHEPMAVQRATGHG